MVSSSMPTFDGRVSCVPLDLTDKFEDKPTKAQVEAKAATMIGQAPNPKQTISVDFIRLSDTEEYKQYASLQQCKLCDTLRVEFPRYGMSGRFKIVKTVYDVLMERFESMELGDLSTTLSEALGLSDSASLAKESAGAVPITSSMISVSTGVLTDGEYIQRGNVIEMRLSFRNTASVASGDNVFVATLNETAIRPAVQTTGATYFGAHTLGGFFNSSGAITIRNASSSAVSFGTSSTGTISFTYIIT